MERLRRIDLMAGAQVVLLVFLGAQHAALAADEEEPGHSRRGADTCVRCHDSEHVLSVFLSAHALKADGRTPFGEGQAQCEACHGPGGAHTARVRRGQERPPIPFYSSGSTASVAEHNDVCLTCHKGDLGLGWHGSAHDSNELSCTGCHTVHAPRDSMLVKGEQADKCYDCHKQQRAASFKASTHPLRFGKMDCSDCHNPHQSVADNLLAKNNLNQLCYSCHAEKRGPYLWEHAPVSEDCSLCHNAHGSNHPVLLTKRPPLLCQQCHSQSGHPNIVYTTRGLADGNNPSGYLLAGSCLNCHSMVHGSNHPSGAFLSR